MKLTTTARHFEASTELVDHARERLMRLKRYFDHILNVDIIMSVEKFRHIAEVNVHVNGHDFSAKEQSDDMYTSIDKAAKSLERQIKKFKGKIIENHHQRRSGQIPPLAELVYDSTTVGNNGGTRLLEEVPADIPTHSIEEAIILMEDHEDHFLLFNNKESGKLSVVYKRRDGNYGVISSG